MDVFRSVVITGGAGMLAHALADALRAKGVTPHLAARAECDVADADSVHRLFKERRPTLLFNCAAHTKVDQCEDELDRANAINGDGPAHLAEQARQAGTRLIHFSTDFVFDGQSDRPYHTDDRPNPLSVYGASKLLGEKRVCEIDPPGWLIVRTAWLFGRYGPCFPQTIVKLAQSGRPLRVVNDQSGCPTATVDLAQTVLKLVERNARGMFHVTNAGETTWYEFAAATLKVFGITADLAPVTTAEWLRMRPKQARRPAYSVLDYSKAEAVVGYPMRDWRLALPEYRTAAEDLAPAAVH